MSRYLSALKKSESAQMTNLINLKNLPSTKDDEPKEPKKPPFASSLGFLGSSYKDIENNQASNDDPEKAVHYAWLIHFTDRNPLSVTFSPMATHGEALANYPDAVAAEPVGQDSMRRILNRDEEVQLRALIETVFLDDSPEDRNEALQVALTDPHNALPCYTAIASERGLIVVDNDDRRFCRECANLRGTVCTVAQPGGAISARKGYTPLLELPHRCKSFNERGN